MGGGDRTGTRRGGRGGAGSGRAEAHRAGAEQADLGEARRAGEGDAAAAAAAGRGHQGRHRAEADGGRCAEDDHPGADVAARDGSVARAPAGDRAWRGSAGRAAAAASRAALDEPHRGHRAYVRGSRGRRQDHAGQRVASGGWRPQGRSEAEVVVRGVALGLAFVIGCGGASTPAAKAPKEDAVDERKAERGAKALVGEIYESIGAGATDGLMSLLADPLIVFGPRRTDAMGTRADALVALKAQIDPKKKKSPVHSGALEVVASPGGHSAWAI